MRSLKNSLRLAVMAGTMVTAAMLTVTNASASTSPTHTLSTTGAKASCAFHTWKGTIHDDHAQINCDLSDTQSDGDWVYVEWWQDGFASVQLRNGNGAGSTKFVSDARVNGDGSFEHLYFRVCRHVAAWPDNCSDHFNWTIP
jgi:hypothetical protein